MNSLIEEKNNDDEYSIEEFFFFNSSAGPAIFFSKDITINLLYYFGSIEILTRIFSLQRRCLLD